MWRNTNDKRDQVNECKKVDRTVQLLKSVGIFLAAFWLSRALFKGGENSLGPV